nr:aromatic ring-hydroxylating dioxygenase subunit alpha [Mycobacterium eburneum]
MEISVAADRFRAALANRWHAVLTAAELLDRPVGVRLLGRPLVLARLRGRPACLDDVCRHLGAALSLGEVVDGHALRCSYHGWAYDGGGRCVDIPARRGAPIPRGAQVASYPTEERYGLIWVCLETPEAAAIPELPEFSDPAFRVTAPRTYEPWRASAPRVVMGALDDTHFGWVHPGLLGDPDTPEAPDHEAHREGDYLITSYSVEQPGTLSSMGTGICETVNYRNAATPTSIRLVKRSATGTYVIFMAVQPVDADRSHVYLLTARDFDLDPAGDERYLTFEDTLQAQDRVVIESQRPWLLPPLESRLALYIRPADLPLIEFQRWLEELGIPQV